MSKVNQPGDSGPSRRSSDRVFDIEIGPFAVHGDVGGAIWVDVAGVRYDLDPKTAKALSYAVIKARDVARQDAPPAPPPPPRGPKVLPPGEDPPA